jgi:hypothetical protein
VSNRAKPSKWIHPDDRAEMEKELQEIASAKGLHLTRKERRVVIRSWYNDQLRKDAARNSA